MPATTTRALLRPAVHVMRRATSRFRPANIAMFHAGRTGSTVVAAMLNGRPDVFWDGEVYQRDWASTARAPSDPITYLRQQMGLAGHRYYGAEFKFFHLKCLGIGIGDFVAHLDGLGFTHFVALRRKNALRTLASFAVGVYTQSADASPTLRPVTLDLGHASRSGARPPLRDRLDEYEDGFCTLDRVLGSRALLHLTYEDDVEADPSTAYRRICDFVGAPPRAVGVRHGRVNPFPLRDMLANFEEVEETLRGTPYAWMLDG